MKTVRIVVCVTVIAASFVLLPSRTAQAAAVAPVADEDLRCTVSAATDATILVSKCWYNIADATGWDVYAGLGMRQTTGATSTGVLCPKHTGAFPGGGGGQYQRMWVGPDASTPWGEVPHGGFVCETKHGFGPLSGATFPTNGATARPDSTVPTLDVRTACDTQNGTTCADVTPATDAVAMGYPTDWFPGSFGFTGSPCEGMEFFMYQDDGDGWDLMTNPLHPTYTGSEDYRYRLGVRFAQPSSGQETEQVDLFFQSDSRYSSGINLGRYPNPQTVEDSSRIYLFDVTSEFLSLQQASWPFEFTRVLGWSERGQCNWGGLSGDSEDFGGTPWLGDPPEAPTSIEDCFTFSGMSLTNPVSWVTGAGRMLACLLQWLFVPSGDSIGVKFDEFLVALEEQFPFSMVFLLIDFLDELGSELESASGTGCFETGGSWSFGDAGSVPVDDVCVGGGLSIGSTTRQLMAVLIIAPMVFTLLSHARATLFGGKAVASA